MDVVFSTHELPEKDRFSYYSEEFTRLFDYYFVVEKPEKTFFAEIRAKMLGDAVLSSINACTYTVWRNEYEIAQARKNYILVGKMLSGVYQFQHDQGLSLIRPGDLFLIDTTQPWHCEIPQDNHQAVVLWLEREKLLSQLTSQDLPAVQMLSKARQPLVTLVDGYLNSLINLEPALSVMTGQSVMEHFRGLLALTLGATEEIRETSGKIGLKAVRLQAVQAYLQQRLGDVGLTPICVAAQFNISPRYLHKLFEEADSSFSQWLLTQRLEQCRLELTDPAHHTRSIAEIAYRWGFNDLSHFGRRFRAQYGIAPRDMRMSRLANTRMERSGI